MRRRTSKTKKSRQTNLSINNSDKFIITKEFIKQSDENFRKEPMYEEYLRPLIEALGKD